MMKNRLAIVYEDDKLLILDKPSGLLTVSVPGRSDPTLFHQASLYVKKQNPSYKVFIVNRLDRWTSGIVVFSRNYQLKLALQKYFEERAVERRYEAVVDGVLTGSDRIVQHLLEDRFGNVFVATSKRGKEAVTDYQALRSDGKTTVVDIALVTGRKNQIRLAFESIGHPILGDGKYGKTAVHKARRLLLNCYRVSFPAASGLRQTVFEIPRIFK